jgi:hypothetical protein
VQRKKDGYFLEAVGGGTAGEGASLGREGYSRGQIAAIGPTVFAGGTSAITNVHNRYVTDSLPSSGSREVVLDS